MNKIFLSILITLSSLHLASSAISAQTLSLSVWPPLLDALVKPGKSITQVYRIQNLGDDTNVKVYMAPFEPDGELGQVSISSTPTPALGYFSLLNADLDLPAEFPLKSGQSQELVLKIAVPESSPEGDHYLTLMIESDSKHLVGGTGAKGKGIVGANVLLSISNTDTPPLTAKIEEFSVGKFALLDSFSPIQFTARVKNTSRFRFKTIGHINIKNTFNRDIATIELRQDNILAGSTRQLLQAAGSEPSMQALFPLGRYTATISVTPEGSANTISQVLTFYVIPYKMILVIVVVVVIYLQIVKFKKQKKIDV